MHKDRTVFLNGRLFEALVLPIILTGQSNLLDKLMYHTSRPLASRVVARSHLEGLDQTQMP
ncbi:MAG: hypothetical protein ACE5LC_05305 [Candidatus Aminicenantales bacterium]